MKKLGLFQSNEKQSDKDLKIVLVDEIIRLERKLGKNVACGTLMYQLSVNDLKHRVKRLREELEEIENDKT